MQAVAVPSLFGTYYLFPSLHAATRIGDRQTLSGSEMTYYTQIMLMPLKGGALLHIVSNQEYTEYKGDWNMQSIETYGEDYNPRAPEAKYEDEEFLLSAAEKYGAKGAKQAQALVDEVSGLFAGGNIADEDLDVMMKALQDAYWIAKEKNKKFTPKKYRRD